MKPASSSHTAPILVAGVLATAAAMILSGAGCSNAGTHPHLVDAYGNWIATIAALLFLGALYIQREELRQNVAEVRRMGFEMELERLSARVAAICGEWADSAEDNQAVLLTLTNNMAWQFAPDEGLWGAIAEHHRDFGDGRRAPRPITTEKGTIYPLEDVFEFARRGTFDQVFLSRSTGSARPMLAHSPLEGLLRLVGLLSEAGAIAGRLRELDGSALGEGSKGVRLVRTQLRAGFLGSIEDLRHFRKALAGVVALVEAECEDPLERELLLATDWIDEAKGGEAET